VAVIATALRVRAGAIRVWARPAAALVSDPIAADEPRPPWALRRPRPLPSEARHAVRPRGGQPGGPLARLDGKAERGGRVACSGQALGPDDVETRAHHVQNLRSRPLRAAAVERRLGSVLQAQLHALREIRAGNLRHHAERQVDAGGDTAPGEVV